MARGKILIIDNNEQRRHDIKLVFDFIGESSKTIGADSWQAHGLKPNELLTTIIGDCGDQENFLRILTSLNQCYPVVPLITIDNTDYQNILRIEQQKNILESIKTPINHQQLLQILEKCRAYQEQLVGLKQKNDQRYLTLFRCLVGISDAMENVHRIMDTIIDTDANVLITGESHTGKEVLARNLHYFSNRQKQPFVVFDCDDIAPEALENKLFGEKNNHSNVNFAYFPGSLELANGGTLLIENIEKLPLYSQKRLLKCVKKRMIRDEHHNHTLPLNVRLLISTHQNVQEAINNGLIDEDLYQFISKFKIRMPALRERIDDLPLLLNELVTRLESKRGKTLYFQENAFKALSHYNWPGNMKELAELVDSLAEKDSNGIIDINELPSHFITKEISQSQNDSAYPRENNPFSKLGTVTLPKQGLNLKQYLAITEKGIIVQALEHCKGVVAHAAKHLYMRRTTLLEKMRRYGLR